MIPKNNIKLTIDKQHTTLHFADQQLSLPIGSQAILGKVLPDELPSPLATETAIMQIEDQIMPLYAQLPQPAQLYTDNPQIQWMAQQLGQANNANVEISLEQVEDLFNRLADIIHGKPATLDSLPITREFTLTLLILREMLNHWRMTSVRVETSKSTL